MRPHTVQVSAAPLPSIRRDAMGAAGRDVVKTLGILQAPQIIGTSVPAHARLPTIPSVNVSFLFRENDELKGRIRCYPQSFQGDKNADDSVELSTGGYGPMCDPHSHAGASAGQRARARWRFPRHRSR